MKEKLVNSISNHQTDFIRAHHILNKQCREGIKELVLNDLAENEKKKMKMDDRFGRTINGYLVQIITNLLSMYVLYNDELISYKEFAHLDDNALDEFEIQCELSYDEIYKGNILISHSQEFSLSDALNEFIKTNS